MLTVTALAVSQVITRVGAQTSARLSVSFGLAPLARDKRNSDRGADIMA